MRCGLVRSGVVFGGMGAVQRHNNSRSSLVVAGADGSVSEFDVVGQCWMRVVAPGPVHCLAVSGSFIVAAGAGGFVQGWAWPRVGMAQPKLLLREEAGRLSDDDITSIAVDGKHRLLITAADCNVQLWSLRDGD